MKNKRENISMDHKLCDSQFGRQSLYCIEEFFKNQKQFCINVTVLKKHLL